MKDGDSVEKPDSLAQEKSFSLTDQVLDEFHACLMKKQIVDKTIADKLVEIARASSKPKAKDIETLLTPKDEVDPILWTDWRRI